MTDNVLEAVKAIIATLQDRKWSDHSEALLISSQGKLAVYQASLSSMVADANQIYLTEDANYEFKKAELFLKFREEGMTIEEAKCNARVEIAFNSKNYIEARRTYEGLRGLLSAVESTITSIQVTLRAINREAGTAYAQNR